MVKKFQTLVTTYIEFDENKIDEDNAVFQTLDNMCVHFNTMNDVKVVENSVVEVDLKNIINLE